MLMALPYIHHQVDEAGRYFGEVVAGIKATEFVVKMPPEAGNLQGVRLVDALPRRGRYRQGLMRADGRCV
jgi:hypothetical protein